MNFATRCHLLPRIWIRKYLSIAVYTFIC